MTSWYELEGKEDEKEEKLEKSPKDDDKTLTILETLLICKNRRQTFNLPEEMRQHLAVALQHPKLFVDKVKYVGQLMKDVPHYASCHIAITFNDDNLLLASKPRNYPLFITCYIREQKVKQILVD